MCLGQFLGPRHPGSCRVALPCAKCVTCKLKWLGLRRSVHQALPGSILQAISRTASLTCRVLLLSVNRKAAGRVRLLLVSAHHSSNLWGRYNVKHTT